MASVSDAMYAEVCSAPHTGFDGCQVPAYFRLTPNGDKTQARYACGIHLHRCVNIMFDQGAKAVVIRRTGGRRNR